MSAVVIALSLAVQPVTPVAPAAPTCPSIELGHAEGQRLHLVMASYSAFYGPSLALEIPASDLALTIYLIRLGAARFGDGRPSIAGETGERLGLRIREPVLDALAQASTIDLVTRDGMQTSIALDTAGLADFRACLGALPPAQEPPRTTADGWTFVALEPGRAPTTLGRGRIDYPTLARVEGRQGLSVTRIDIGVDGLPKSCTIASSSGHADLDAAACRSAMRSTFRTATDASGEPIAAVVSLPYRWIIGD